jgi:hypothetical protein
MAATGGAATMALMTPRGLKIRLDLERAFSLLGRLWVKDQRTDAFRVLKTCEAIELIPELLSLCVGLAIAVQLGTSSVWWVVPALLGGRIAGFFLIAFGRIDVLRAPGLLWCSLVWSYVPFHLELMIALVGIPLVLGFHCGWQLGLLWITGCFLAVVVQMLLELVVFWRHHRLSGEPITMAETSFFNAYRLHADRLGLPRDITVDDEEVASGIWVACLKDYASKWPEAVARFPVTQETQQLID